MGEAAGGAGRRGLRSAAGRVHHRQPLASRLGGHFHAGLLCQRREVARGQSQGRADLSRRSCSCRASGPSSACVRSRRPSGPSAAGPSRTCPLPTQILKTIDDVGRLEKPNARTDGLLPFVVRRLQLHQKAIENAGHSIRFAVSRGPLNIASFLMGTTEFLMAIRTNPDEMQRLPDADHGFHRRLAAIPEGVPAVDRGHLRAR